MLMEVLGIDSMIGPSFSSVLHSPEALIETSPPATTIPPGCARLFGDDVDDAIDRIRSPTPARVAKHFDSSVSSGGTSRVSQKAPGESRRIDATPMHHHHEFAAEPSAESARGHRPSVGIGLRYILRSNHPQEIRNVNCLRALCILVGDHENCRSRACQRFLFLRTDVTLDFRQIFNRFA